MSTYGSDKKKITLDQNGKSGYSTRLYAYEGGMEAARAAIRATAGCSETCPQEGEKTRLLIRIAADDDIAIAVKIYRYNDTDHNHLYGWYLDGDVNTCCQCAEITKPGSVLFPTYSELG